MKKINPQILYDGDNKVGVFLSKEDFNQMVERIEDLEDSLIPHTTGDDRIYTQEEAYKMMGFSEEDIKEIEEHKTENPFKEE